MVVNENETDPKKVHPYYYYYLLNMLKRSATTVEQTVDFGARFIKVPRHSDYPRSQSPLEHEGPLQPGTTSE
jgi:hypothetical protein